jgi:hypothetical protein
MAPRRTGVQINVALVRAARASMLVNVSVDGGSRGEGERI